MRSGIAGCQDEADDEQQHGRHFSADYRPLFLLAPDDVFRCSLGGRSPRLTISEMQGHGQNNETGKTESAPWWLCTQRYSLISNLGNRCRGFVYMSRYNEVC